MKIVEIRIYVAHVTRIHKFSRKKMFFRHREYRLSKIHNISKIILFKEKRKNKSIEIHFSIHRHIRPFH